MFFFSRPSTREFHNNLLFEGDTKLDHLYTACQCSSYIDGCPVFTPKDCRNIRWYHRWNHWSLRSRLCCYPLEGKLYLVYQIKHLSLLFFFYRYSAVGANAAIWIMHSIGNLSGDLLLSCPNLLLMCRPLIGATILALPP
jgi:hypothetical protein